MSSWKHGWTPGIVLASLAVAAVAVSMYFNQPKACKVTAKGKVSVRVTGLSWDADSSGFAFLQGLSAEDGAKKAGRLNSRVYVDGQPDRFAITATDPRFQIEFETDQPTFRLIAEGDRFPRTISQPYEVPKHGCDIEVARLNAPRGDGPEHTWPLPMVASKMGYNSWNELMADNNAVIRLLTYGSGEEGAPEFTDRGRIEAKGTKVNSYPFDMDKKITFLQEPEENTGAFMIVIPFSADELADKMVSLSIVDTITEAKWNPPRPWKFDPVDILVRNGFATDVRVSPSADQ